MTDNGTWWIVLHTGRTMAGPFPTRTAAESEQYQRGWTLGTIVVHRQPGDDGG